MIFCGLYIGLERSCPVVQGESAQRFNGEGSQRFKAEYPIGLRLRHPLVQGGVSHRVFLRSLIRFCVGVLHRFFCLVVSCFLWSLSDILMMVAHFVSLIPPVGIFHAVFRVLRITDTIRYGRLTSRVGMPCFAVALRCLMLAALGFLC